MKRENRRRMLISSSYIGAGNIASVFNRKSKTPYKKIKELYGEELERFNSKRNLKNISKKKLTKSEKDEIKNRVRKNLKQEMKKELIIGIIAVIILIIIVNIINNYR